MVKNMADLSPAEHFLYLCAMYDEAVIAANLLPHPSAGEYTTAQEQTLDNVRWSEKAITTFVTNTQRREAIAAGLRAKEATNG